MDNESGVHEDEQGTETPQANGSPESAPAAIDIATLAAKVYRLMLDDVRLERARNALRRP